MSAAGRVRVLVVDDSAFARKVVRETLSASPAIEVVGSARDGFDALEKVALLAPDVVTLDLVMPGLDGLGFIASLPSKRPHIVVVSSAAEESELVIAALQMGAFGFVPKPTAQATDRLYEIQTPLTAAVLAAHAAARAPQALAPAEAVGALGTTRQKIIVVGASTGGPQALTRLLGDLPAGLPVPVAIVLHIPVGYTEALASRLDQGSALAVREGRQGLVMRPATVTVARAGEHLVIRRGEDDAPVAHLAALPRDTAHRPSVDVLFASAAAAFGADVLGVVLSGMGVDGLRGAQAIHAAGGSLLIQSEESCVVYGMPRAVMDAGLSAESVSLEGMAAAVVARL